MVVEPLVHIDLAHNAAEVYLTLTIPKEIEEFLIADLLREVSRAFAAAEGVSEDWMHAELEKHVRAFENDTDFKFVWGRSFQGQDPRYPDILREHLAAVQGNGLPN